MNFESPQQVECEQCGYPVDMWDGGEWEGEHLDPETGIMRGRFYYNGWGTCCNCGWGQKMGEPWRMWE